jgi:hypothetical protein
LRNRWAWLEDCARAFRGGCGSNISSTFIGFRSRLLVLFVAPLGVVWVKGSLNSFNLSIGELVGDLYAIYDACRPDSWSLRCYNWSLNVSVLFKSLFLKFTESESGGGALISSRNDLDDLKSLTFVFPNEFPLTSDVSNDALSSSPHGRK